MFRISALCAKKIEVKCHNISGAVMTSETFFMSALYFYGRINILSYCSITHQRSLRM